MNAEDIKARRLKLGMTQAELADALGLALNTISRWELGASQPDGAKMLDLALTQLEWQKTLTEGSLAENMQASIRQLEAVRYELGKLVADSEETITWPKRTRKTTRKAG